MSDNININKINELLKIYGIKCISEMYVNETTLLLWECILGHRWKRSLANIKNTNNCPECQNIKFKNKKLGEIKEYAKSKGGECLSNEYTDMKTKMKFKCEKNHEWDNYL